MTTLMNLIAMFPETLSGVFSFYPAVILILTVFILFITGLRLGLRHHGSKIIPPDEDTAGLIARLSILQTVCLLLIILSLFAYVNPWLTPGGLKSEVGIGFAIAAATVIFLAAPAVFNFLDRAFVILGEVIIFLYDYSRTRNFEPGCMAVQTVQKHSPSPGPRARDITPEKHGDYVDYIVDKFRRVVSVGRGEVTLITRRGKLVRMKISDPRLRKPGLIERLRYYGKFPSREMTDRLVHVLSV